MSLFWLPPVMWFTAVGGVLLYLRAGERHRLPFGVASFSLLLTVLGWPVETEIQRIYSPYQLLEQMARATA